MVDARGLSCPRPVMMAEEEINNNNPKDFVVLVDNKVAEKNVTDFVECRGYKVEHAKKGRDFKLICTKLIIN